MIKKYFDQHTHSSFSPDSKEDMKNYYDIANKNGIEYVSTCEHYDVDLVVDGTTWVADYPKLIAYQKELNEIYPNVKGLVGIELGYKPSVLNKVIEMSNKYDYDIIQLSVHDNGIYDYYYKEAFDSNNYDEVIDGYFLQIMDGMNKIEKYDVVSHIDFAFKTLKKIDNSVSFNKYEERIKELLKLIIERDKALEINSKVQSTIEDIDGNNEHLKYILNLYKSLGGKKLTLSSDAHRLENYRLNFDKYMKIIKECGFDYLVYYIKRVEYKYYL